MSVRHIEVCGNRYIRAGRSVNGVQYRELFKYDDDTYEEALAKGKAADAKFKSLQQPIEPTTFMEFFCRYGEFKHIKLQYPHKRSRAGWRLCFQLDNVEHGKIQCNRSIDVHGFDVAFNECFDYALEVFGFCTNSVHAMVLKDIWKNTLQSRYKRLKNNFT